MCVLLPLTNAPSRNAPQYKTYGLRHLRAPRSDIVTRAFRRGDNRLHQWREPCTAARRRRAPGRRRERSCRENRGGCRATIPGWKRCVWTKSSHGKAVPWQHFNRCFPNRVPALGCLIMKASLNRERTKDKPQNQGADPPVSPLSTGPTTAHPSLPGQVPPPPPRLSSRRHGSPSSRVPHPRARPETRRALRLPLAPGLGSCPRGASRSSPPQPSTSPCGLGRVSSQPHARALRNPSPLLGAELSSTRTGKRLFYSRMTGRLPPAATSLTGVTQRPMAGPTLRPAPARGGAGTGPAAPAPLCPGTGGSGGGRGAPLRPGGSAVREGRLSREAAPWGCTASRRCSSTWTTR